MLVHPAALTRLARAEHIHAELAADLRALASPAQAAIPAAGRTGICAAPDPPAMAQDSQTSRAAHGSAEQAAGQGAPGVIPGGP